MHITTNNTMNNAFKRHLRPSTRRQHKCRAQMIFTNEENTDMTATLMKRKETDNVWIY